LERTPGWSVWMSSRGVLVAPAATEKLLVCHGTRVEDDALLGRPCRCCCVDFDGGRDDLNFVHGGQVELGDDDWVVDGMASWCCFGVVVDAWELASQVVDEDDRSGVHRAALGPGTPKENARRSSIGLGCCRR
jgi:hypothetical protein